MNIYINMNIQINSTVFHCNFRTYFVWILIWESDIKPACLMHYMHDDPQFLVLMLILNFCWRLESYIIRSQLFQKSLIWFGKLLL